MHHYLLTASLFTTLLSLGFTLVTPTALAADSGGSDNAIEEHVQGALPVEPQIVIRREDEKTFYEYRVNGVLKEIKVVPSVGPTYYLVPADGGGWIQEDRSQVLIPKWILFEW